MTIARCSVCGDEVRLPTGASGRATVECPHCGTRSELATWFASLPPLLMVIDDPEPHPVSLAVDDEPALEAVPKFDFVERAAPSAVAVQPAVRTGRPSTSVRRRAQPKGGGLLGIAAVLGGGLCALPLAQLVLWWLFGRDPVELGPKVAAYVPFVVPSELRGGPLPLPTNDASNEAGRADDRREGHGRDERGPRRTPLANPNGSNDPTGVDRRVPSTDAADDRSGNEGPGSLSVAPPNGSASPGSLAPLPARPAELDDLAPADIDEIDAEVRTLLLAHEDWIEAETLSDDERTERLDAYFESYCRLGERLARFDPHDPEADRILGIVDGTLAGRLDDAKLRAFLANRTERKLDDSTAVDGSPGIALVGTVAAIEPGSPFRTVVMRLGSGNGGTVRIAAWAPLPGALQPGATAVVLGRIDTPDRFGWDPTTARGAAILGGFVLVLDPASGGAR